MKTDEKILAQHAENKEWIGNLKFYNDDLKVMKHRLTELTSKNNHQEVLAEVEHFQNQFIIQQKNIDEILEMVKKNEDALEQEIKANPTAVDHRKTEYHAKEKEAVKGFEKNFNMLREEFKEFAAKWM